MNDDQLGRELRGLVPTGWPVPPKGAAAAVRTARRRTTGRLLATSALVVAVAAGVPATLAAQTTSAPAPVASQPDSTTTVPPVPPLPVPEPSVEEPTTPVSAAPVEPVEPSAPPSPVPPVESVPPAAPSVPAAPSTPEPPPTSFELVDGPRPGVVRGGELSGFDFERSYGPDVERDFAPLPGAATWTWDACDTGGPDEGRTGWWSFGDGTDGPSYDGTGRFVAEDRMQVATYVDEDAARAALEDLRDRTSCLTDEREAPSYWWVSSAADGDVVQGAVHFPWTAMDSPDDVCGFDFVRAVRDGRVIVLQQQLLMGSDCGWGSPMEEDAEQDHDPLQQAVLDHLG